MTFFFSGDFVAVAPAADLVATVNWVPAVREAAQRPGHGSLRDGEPSFFSFPWILGAPPIGIFLGQARVMQDYFANPNNHFHADRIDGAEFLLPRAIYLPTLLSPMSMPSLRSSPWIGGALQSGLSRLIRRISSRVSTARLGRPLRPRRDFHVQNKWKLVQCQSNSCFRLEDKQGGAPINRNLGWPDRQKPIGCDQLRPLHRATQDSELAPKCEDFPPGGRFEIAVAAAKR